MNNKNHHNNSKNRNKIKKNMYEVKFKMKGKNINNASMINQLHFTRII